MKGILIRSAAVLALCAAPGTAWAQTETPKPPVQPQGGQAAPPDGTAAGETAPSGSGSNAPAENETTGEKSSSGGAGAQVNVTSEQQTEIRQVITETKVEPVPSVDFTVNVGTAVPQAVTLHPLPPRIIELVPEYESYEYFVLADGRIVIVDPGSHEIVLIIS